MNKKQGVVNEDGGIGQLKVFYPSLLGNTELLKTLLSRVQIIESYVYWTVHYLDS